MDQNRTRYNSATECPDDQANITINRLLITNEIYNGQLYLTIPQSIPSIWLNKLHYTPQRLVSDRIIISKYH